MAQNNAQKQLQQYDTDIAVLKVEFKNLDEKFDTSLQAVKDDIKEVQTEIRSGNASTHKILIDHQKSNQNSHDQMAVKITALERWRWMLIGAGMVAGTLGYAVIELYMSH
jgi:hypothetical protein|tara:strand:+ start:3857 stop:4186 length:330 start_codon:yes stop_codon:yes gene_type:complete